MQTTLEQRKEGNKDTLKDTRSNSNAYSWSYGKENHVHLNSTSSSSQSSIANTDDGPLTPGSDLGVDGITSPRRSPKPLVMKRCKSEDLGKVETHRERERNDDNLIFLCWSLLKK